MAEPAAYLAVVKYPLHAPAAEKRRLLVEGLALIALELVEEHGLGVGLLNDAFEEAQWGGGRGGEEARCLTGA